MAKQIDTRQLVHTPAELASEHLEWAERLQKDPGITFGIDAVDKRVIPMRPGDLVSIIARPGHGKTSFMAFLARKEAARIVERGTAEKEVVVYVTWEQSAEELEGFFQTDGEYSSSDIAWGRIDLDEVRKRAVKRANLPIWVIGHGISRAGLDVPRMTTEIVLSAIETMEADFGVKPALMLFDYMQLIPVRGYRDRVQQVTEVPIRVKKLALRIGTPAVVGVQARREVDERKQKIPEIRDAQWASSIEQTSDKVFGLWRPWLTERPNIPIKLLEEEYEVTETLFVLRMLKQRFEVGRHTWILYFAPHLMTLAEMEVRDELHF